MYILQHNNKILQRYRSSEEIENFDLLKPFKQNKKLKHSYFGTFSSRNITMPGILFSDLSLSEKNGGKIRLKTTILKKVKFSIDSFVLLKA